MNNNEILAFLKTEKMMVISTAGQAPYPESAMVAFVQDDDLCVYFQTGAQTRKAENIAYNPCVALTMGLTENTKYTVQYEGNAELLRTDDEITLCKQRFIGKSSPAVPFLDRPGTQFYRIRPAWIGFTDYSAGKPVVIELRPDAE